jgi:hypothetical protein
MYFLHLGLRFNWAIYVNRQKKTSSFKKEKHKHGQRSQQGLHKHQSNYKLGRIDAIARAFSSVEHF